MKHQLNVEQTGYGHWRITTTHYGRKISAVTTNSVAIDDYNSDEYEKDGRELRKLRGYKSLRDEVIRLNSF